jgi:hypothetical protein
MTISFISLGVIVGFCLPMVVLDDDTVPHCTSGCKPAIATRDGKVCAQITVAIVPLGGNPGFCECDPPTVCKKMIDCNIDLSITFSGSGTLPGCVFDRDMVGGPWGQTGYTTSILGCGAFGKSRIVGYSATCDSNVIGCSVTMDLFCPKCTGTCP